MAAERAAPTAQPRVAELQATGATSLRAIAAGLNARGIPRGGRLRQPGEPRCSGRGSPPAYSYSSVFSGVTSMSVARSFAHSSSVIGLSLIRYLPSVWSTCQASRQRAGSRFFSQKI
jgi:hypothetical protein